MPVQVGGFTIITFTRHLLSAGSSGINEEEFQIIGGSQGIETTGTGRPSSNLKNYTIKSLIISALF
jgi:hypothetical protein